MLNYVKDVKPQIYSLMNKIDSIQEKLRDNCIKGATQEALEKQLSPLKQQLKPLYAVPANVSEEFARRVSNEGVNIRWMIRKYIPEILGIEGGSFENPWSEDDFTRCLRQRNCIGMIAEHDKLVVGFMVYELHKDQLHVLNLATNPHYRRMGVGTAMVDKLIGKLSQEGRNRIMLEVRETNLVAQQFFRASGLRATSILRDYYDDVEDAYVMKYTYVEPSDVNDVPQFQGQNRMADYMPG